MLPNYAMLGRVKQMCVEAGMTLAAAEDIAERVNAGRVSEADVPSVIEQERERNPTYFGVTGPDEYDEQVAAFGPSRTLKAQADFVTKHGAVHAQEVAARFGTTVGALRGGTIPHDVKKQVEARNPERGKVSNPWHPSHCDARGCYTPHALTLQANALRGMGEVKAAQLAAVWSARLGSLRPDRAV